MHAHLPALCVHLNEGCLACMYWTTVSPSAFTKHTGAWLGWKTVAGAAAARAKVVARAKVRTARAEAEGGEQPGEGGGANEHL